MNAARRPGPSVALALGALAASVWLLVRNPGDAHLWEGLGLGLVLGAGLRPLARRAGGATSAGAGAVRSPDGARGATTGPGGSRAGGGRGPAGGGTVAPARPAGATAPAGPGTARPSAGRVLILADPGLAAELLAAVERWGWRGERAERTARVLARLVAAAEAGAPYGALLVERARLPIRPSELIRAVQEDAGLRGLRVVLLDPEATRLEEANLRHAGYAAVLGLPLDKTLLFSALHSSARAARGAENAVSLASYYRQRRQERARRVLVADDNALSRNALKAILERADYVVHVARDGEEALDVLERGRPPIDLVILDVRMPGRSGVDVLRAYRFMQPDAAVPVVMLTAETSPELREACVRAGASAFLHKPVDPQALLAVLAGLDPRQPGRALAPPAVPESAAPARVRLEETTLEALRRLGREPGFLTALVEGYVREGAQSLARVERALGDADHAAFLDMLQALRGASGDIGAREVAALCERLQEIPAERLDSPRVALLVEALGRAFEATAVALTEYLERVEDAAR